jgi:hypothetical protein
MNTHTSSLTEGMRENDLVDLVLPLMSVDEYQSKIDEDEAIVIGFYVHDEDAARDLNRFLQKSATPLLATEVSPAPDQFGYYMVFVELMNNERLAENIRSILQEIDTLVDLEEDDWQMRIRGNDDLLHFSEATLNKGLQQAKKHSKKTEVIEYLQYSALENAEFADQVLVLESAADRMVLNFIDFAPIEQLLTEFKLVDRGIDCDIRSMTRTNKFKRLLGETWEASKFGNYILLHTDHDPRGLLLRL